MHTSPPSLMHAISMRKCSKHKPFLRGAHILTWRQKKHFRICASVIAFYPVCIHVQLMPWNLMNLIHGQLAQCSLPLRMSFPHSDLHFYHPHMHFFQARLSIHHKLPYWQHSLQLHSEGESRPPLCTLLVLMQTKEWNHPEESNMVSKCKHTKENGQQTMLNNICLLPFYLTF